MKTLIAAAAVALSLVAAHAHAAVPITYTGRTSAGDITATFSFTTNGSTGNQVQVQVVSYDVSITSGKYGTFDLTPLTSQGNFGFASANQTNLNFYSAMVTSNVSQSGYADGFVVFSGGTDNTVQIGRRDEQVFSSVTLTAVSVPPPPTSVSAAPEPGTWALMLGGVGMVGAMMRVAQARRREDELKSIATA